MRYSEKLFGYASVAEGVLLINLEVMKSFLTKHVSSVFWIGLGVVVFAALGFGWLIGQHLASTAHQHQDCASPGAGDSWQGLVISGAPTSLESSFGYGRGTQVIESFISVAALKGQPLPTSITVFATPLISSDGTAVILPIQGSEHPQTPAAISAVAIQVSSSIYRLEVCIRAPNAAPGSYGSQLMFPGASSAASSDSSAAVPAAVPVTVSFQSEAVPYILTMGIVPLSLLGMLYCTLILVRRSKTDEDISSLPTSLRQQLWSINGIIAAIVSLGAVFAAWNLQCYRNPTWGTPWPVVLTVLATMAGAAAGASTVPMGLSTLLPQDVKAEN